MSHTAALRIACALGFLAGASSGASAWGWWDRCSGYCYGPPYGNYEPPQIFVYDYRVGPTWTGNGWAQLPVGTYSATPPVAVAPPPPPARAEVYRERYAYPSRKYRPLK